MTSKPRTSETLQNFGSKPKTLFLSLDFFSLLRVRSLAMALSLATVATAKRACVWSELFLQVLRFQSFLSIVGFCMQSSL